MKQLRRLHPEFLFDPRFPVNDLGGKSIRGGMVTMSSQAILFAITLTRTIILSRLLTPEDFGLIGMVMVVVNFAAMFKDAGLSMATVQKDHITHEQISTLFWINVIISSTLGLCMLAGAPLVAWFYNETALTAVTVMLSLSFIVSGLSMQHAALLQRHMYFSNLAIINISAQALSLLVTILLALAGWRYWALVAGTMILSLVTVLLTLFFCPWVPGRMQKGTGVRDMLRFGGHLTGFNFINYFSRNLDNILIGKYIGAVAVGLYSKAYQIVYLPLANIRDPINAVALPALSALQNDPHRFRNYYNKIVFSLAFFSMPLMAFCIMFPEDLILLIYGEQWLSVTTAFRLLAIAGFIQTIAGTRGMLLLAYGRSDLFLKFGVVHGALAVVGFTIGLSWGINGVATSFVIISYLPQLPLFAIAFHVAPITFRDLLDSCMYATLYSWSAVLVTRAILHWLPVTGIVAFLSAALVMVVLYAALFMAVPASRKQLLEMLSLIRSNINVPFSRRFSD